MLIKFEIQVDGSSGARAVQAQALADPNLPAAKELSSAFKPGAGSGPPVNGPHTKGGGPPSASGSGTVLVIGPIVICGSGTGHAGFGAGGGPPVTGPHTP